MGLPESSGSAFCCGEGAEEVEDRRLGLTGRRCSSCRRAFLMTDRLLAALRPAAEVRASTADSGETLFVPGAKTPLRKRYDDEDEERDRVFAFLLGVPLELSDDVNPRPPVIVAMMSLCVAVFVPFLALPGLADILALHVWEVSWRTPLELVTCIFVHWDFLHLGGNLYFLYVFGRAVEDRLGSAGTFALLAASGLAGGLASLGLLFGEEISVGGASGAVSGLLGVYLLLFPTRSLGLSLFFFVIRVPALIYIVFWLLFQVLAFSNSEGDVAYEAHIAGFAVGVLAAAWTRLRERFRPAHAWPASAGGS